MHKRKAVRIWKLGCGKDIKSQKLFANGLTLRNKKNTKITVHFFLINLKQLFQLTICAVPWLPWLKPCPKQKTNYHNVLQYKTCFSIVFSAIICCTITVCIENLNLKMVNTLPCFPLKSRILACFRWFMRKYVSYFLQSLSWWCRNGIVATFFISWPEI